MLFRLNIRMGMKYDVSDVNRRMIDGEIFIHNTYADISRVKRKTSKQNVERSSSMRIPDRKIMAGITDLLRCLKKINNEIMPSDLPCSFDINTLGGMAALRLLSF